VSLGVGYGVGLIRLDVERALSPSCTHARSGIFRTLKRCRSRSDLVLKSCKPAQYFCVTLFCTLRFRRPCLTAALFSAFSNPGGNEQEERPDTQYHQNQHDMPRPSRVGGQEFNQQTPQEGTAH
jgi:hypothetical protein